MKLLVILFLITFLPVFVTAQTTVPTVEQEIQRTLDSGVYYGITAKHISRIGDAAAVALTKVLGDKSVKGTEIRLALIVLNDAFARREIVENVSDREPRTALLLLQYLKYCTSDPQLREEIAKERDFILGRYLNLKTPKN